MMVASRTMKTMRLVPTLPEQQSDGSIRWGFRKRLYVLSESAKEGEMRCRRCDGFMLKDRFYDLLDDCGGLSIDAWRCVNCGEVLDGRIESNRSRAVWKVTRGFP